MSLLCFLAFRPIPRRLNLTNLEAYERTALENLTKKRISLLKELRLDLVTHVTCEYDGCGDSGQLEEPVLHYAGEPKELSAAGTNVHDLMYEALELAYDGYENNEGGFGTITWTIATDTIRIEHDQRYEATEHEEMIL